MNGDGKPDLILTYQAQQTSDPSGIAIYLNNGTASPFNNVMPLRFFVGQTVEAVALADLNGDGKVDLVAVISNGQLTINDLEVFLNTGSATQPFNTSQALQPDSDLGGGCLAVTIGDVNGDGHPDLVFGCTAPVANASSILANPAIGAIYLNNGSASPFSNVAPIDLAAQSDYPNTYARSVFVGALVKNSPPDILITDGPISTADQPGLASYVTTELDQNPVAANHTSVCAINKSIRINVVADDTPSAGQSLNVASVTIIAQPQHGTTTVNSTDGSVTYQAANGYSGSDSFQYTIRDNLGAVSNAASVNMTIQPAPVTANDTASVSANQNVTIDVLANDKSTGGALNSASLAIVVAPTQGTAVVTNGKVLYTPTSAYSGLDTFQYSVQDNLGTTSNVSTVSIEVTAAASSSKSSGGSMGLLDLLALVGILGTTRVLRPRSGLPPVDRLS